MSGLRFPPTLALTLSSLFWAGNFIVGRALRDAVPAVALNYWRWLVALVVLLPFAFPVLRRHAALLRKEWRLTLTLAVTGIAAFHLCVYVALQTTTAVNALLFLSVSPLLILLGAWLRYREPITGRQLVAVALSLLGVLAIASHGEPARLLGLQFHSGDLWMLAAVSLWAAYSVALKATPQALPQTALLGGTVIVAVALMTPLYVLAGAGGPRVPLDAGVLAGLLYVGLFASVIAYFCWNYGVARVGPGRAGVFLHLMPLFGAVLSTVILREGIEAYHWLGAGLIAGGIILSGTSRAPR